MVFPQSASGKALFVADLHLTERRPQTVRAFLDFLDGPAHEAASLWILGDLFEAWPGDDDLHSPLPARISSALKALRQHGVDIAFMHGNRDFLVGNAFAEAAGLTLLEDPTEVVIDGKQLLLSHGDLLCTDDVAYQEWRKKARSPAFQAAFLAAPLAERKRIVEDYREQSEQAKTSKTTQIMDINAEALSTLLKTHDFPVLIHGHTHRPAQHRFEVDGRHCTRWVLADWHDHASWLECVDGQILPMPEQDYPLQQEVS